MSGVTGETPVQPVGPRRQWGAERRSEPMPIVHLQPSIAKLTWGRVAIVVTITCWVGYVVSTVVRRFLDDGGGFRFTMEAVGYLSVVTFLTWSALMYLVARQGALRRFREHRRVPRGLLDAHFTDEHDAMTVLVPSYAEEPDVVRLTLWSAALQEYPDLRVVLLVDDPPFPTDPEVTKRLDQTRALAEEITETLTKPHARALTAYHDARTLLADEVVERAGGDAGAQTGHAGEAEPTEAAELDEKAAALALATPDPSGSGGPDDLDDLEALLEHVSAPLPLVRRLAEEYTAAAEWLEQMGTTEVVADHVSEFFVDQVLMGLASELRLSLLALDAVLLQRDAELPAVRLLELHRRLIWIFGARVGVFERKRYASLSQEANKAMNINSYLGLMGGRWRPTETAAGVELRRVAPTGPPQPGDLDIENTTYVLTLDADSQLLRDYCLRLVYFLEQPENEKVAIVQTPYSSFRGAPTRIERIAGATTDIQHILHQGMTAYDATFWVGANAVIRRRALEDIVEVDTVGGHEIRTYIQDRTVIEDTESSVDIATAGWRLVNYPERLSYSATPPDFGSLVVQRRRWANGGLLILPKFWMQRRQRAAAGRPLKRLEIALRVNYMASLAWASLGLLFLLFYPYDGRLLSPLVVGAALPYFIAMSSDLNLCGHRYLDVFRIYGFNLVLLPVNLAGVLKSIQQAFTGEKIPFVRTPKVRNRTASPGLYVLVPYLVVLYSLLTAWRDYHHHNWPNFAFAVFNAVLAAGAIRAYIGITNSLIDMGMGVVNWLMVPKRRPVAAAPTPAQGGAQSVDWASILYHGDRRLGRDLRRRDDRRRRLTQRRR
ncbi:glycosyltransferase family 2 protein [Nocardioides sp. BP30]|uniref:glycosyltransferase family 2 protein n=1 Tax=Nocardioides sp. BP30 TaxID=3036374 RepID=UPI0024691A84|nr:glycosyltransferase family 2 protein [Nocardioides sp. BP30]WGL50753.1 glycosyltransferase family 2 protein [Nocardioides sp. BP30]